MSERFVHGVSSFSTVLLEASLNSPGIDDYGDGMDNDGNRYGRHTHGIEQEPLFTKFQAFLTRASSCRSIFSSGAPSARAGQSSQPHSQFQSTQNLSITLSSSTNPNPNPKQKEHVILLEDLPNILHASTQSQFHASLQALLTSPASAPIVIIISDTGVRGEVGDERLASGEVVGGGRAGWGREGVVDVRSVLGGGLLGSGYVTQIGYVFLLSSHSILFLNFILFVNCAPCPAGLTQSRPPSSVKPSNPFFLGIFPSHPRHSKK